MTDPNGLSCCKCATSSCDLSGLALVEYILFCHILWWVSYYFLLLITKQSEEWCCRFLTFFHGCLISYSALRDAYSCKSPIDFQTIPLSLPKKYYLSYMLSYFLFDFCWMHFYGNETWIIYFHHLSSIVIISNVLIKNYGAVGVSYGAAGLEFTNPYLQLRWFLRTHGYHRTLIHKITELWFMLLFFLIRILGGTILMYYSVMRSDADILMKISFLSIYGISLVLQWQIFMYFKKKYLTSNNHENVRLISSIASLSPYFQRRTFDRENRDTGNADAQQTRKSADLGSVSQRIESSTVQPVLIKTSTIGTLIESLKVDTATLESPKSELSKFSEERKESYGEKSVGGKSLGEKSMGGKSLGEKSTEEKSNPSTSDENEI